MDWERSQLSAESLEERLNALPELFGPLKKAMLAAGASGAWIEGKGNGPLLAGPRPDLGTHAYDIVLFSPLPADALTAYQALHGFELSDAILQLLRHLNGCVLFGLKLYGVPPSMARNPPLLDRSGRAPLDIASGRFWRVGYAEAAPEDTLFASRNVGDSGQVGYFMSPEGRISGRGNRSPEAPVRCGPWTNLADWLIEELA